MNNETQRDIASKVKPILEKYYELKGLEHGEMIIKATVHNRRIVLINVTEEEKFKFS